MTILRKVGPSFDGDTFVMNDRVNILEVTDVYNFTADLSGTFSLFVGEQLDDDWMVEMDGALGQARVENARDGLIEFNTDAALVEVIASTYVDVVANWSNLSAVVTDSNNISIEGDWKSVVADISNSRAVNVMGSWRPDEIAFVNSANISGDGSWGNDSFRVGIDTWNGGFAGFLQPNGTANIGTIDGGRDHDHLTVDVNNDGGLTGHLTLEVTDIEAFDFFGANHVAFEDGTAWLTSFGPNGEPLLTEVHGVNTSALGFEEPTFVDMGWHGHRFGDGGEGGGKFF